MGLKSPKSQEKTEYGIRKAHFSFVICGSDNRHWVAHAFVRNGSDSENLEDKIFSYDGMNEDPIASNDDPLNANDPLWDPREYWLMVFKIRMAQVVKKSERVVRSVEASIRRHVGGDSSSYSEKVWSPDPTNACSRESNILVRFPSTPKAERDQSKTSRKPLTGLNKPLRSSVSCQISHQTQSILGNNLTLQMEILATYLIFSLPLRVREWVLNSHFVLFMESSTNWKGFTKY
jgi:hypothetical protein